MRYLMALLLLLGCTSDETLTGYAPHGVAFTLSRVNDQPANIAATLTLSANGAIRGQGPCNGYFSQITAPYPWFELDAIAATRRACPNLAAETQYFDLLKSMTLAEVAGGTILLSNDAGQSLEFKTP